MDCDLAQSDIDRSSILPIFIFIFLLLCFALLQPPGLIFIGDLVSREDVGSDKSHFQITGGEGRFSMTQPLETNDAVGSHTVNESNDTGQNLDS